MLQIVVQEEGACADIFALLGIERRLQGRVEVDAAKIMMLIGKRTLDARVGLLFSGTLGRLEFRECFHQAI